MPMSARLMRPRRRGVTVPALALTTAAGDLLTAASGEALLFQPPTAPFPPTIVEVTRVPVGANISFLPPTWDGGSTITGYAVAVDGIPAQSGAPTTDPFNVGALVMSFDDAELSDGSEVALAAYNAIGTSAADTITFTEV